MGHRERISRLSERESALLDERTPASASAFARAEKVLAGGVASSYQARAPWPIYLSHGEGQRVWDVDGNEYFDFHMASRRQWGGGSTSLRGSESTPLCSSRPTQIDASSAMRLLFDSHESLSYEAPDLL